MPEYKDGKFVLAMDEGDYALIAYDNTTLVAVRNYTSSLKTLGYAAGEAYILNTGLGEWIMPELHGDKLKYKAMINALKNEVKPLTDNLENSATTEGRRNLFKQIFNIGKKLKNDEFARQQFISKTADPLKVITAHAAGEAFEELSEEVLADFSKSAFNAVNWLRGDETRMSVSHFKFLAPNVCLFANFKKSSILSLLTI